MNKIIEFLKKHCVMLFFCFLFLLRLPLIFNGHLFFPDEERYFFSLSAFEQLIQGHFKTVIMCIFGAAARPIYIIFGIICAAMQHIFKSRFFPVGMSYEQAKQSYFFSVDPHFFDFVSLINLLVTIGILIIFYRICLHFFKKRSFALLTTLIYSLLWNSYLYIRHLVPYDYSLLCFMTMILLMINARRKYHFLMLGLLAGIGFGLYPGYGVFVIVPGVFLIGKIVENKKYILHLLLYGLGFISIISGLEILSHFAGSSYLSTCQDQVHGITQGDSSENFTFFYKCLTQVEGAHGIILFILFFIGFWFLIIKRKSFSPLTTIIFTILTGYMLYAIKGFFSKDIVFYGRIIHMYMPFLVLGAMIPLICLPKKFRTLALWCITISSIISFCFSAPKFYSAVYPREVIYNAYKQVKDPQYMMFLSEDFELQDQYKQIVSTYQKRKKVLLINSKYYSSIAPFFNVVPVEIEGFDLIKSFSHPLNLTPYQFEGFTPSARNKIRDRNYQIRVYVRENNDMSHDLFKTDFWLK